MKQLPPTSPRTWPVRGRSLRRAPVVLVLIAVVVLAGAGPAAATTREHLTTDHWTIPIDYGNSFTCPDGHAVDVTRDGFLRVTLYRNSSGRSGVSWTSVGSTTSSTRRTPARAGPALCTSTIYSTSVRVPSSAPR
jgi:hypothetical protein